MTVGEDDRVGLLGRVEVTVGEDVRAGLLGGVEVTVGEDETSAEDFSCGGELMDGEDVSC